MPGGTKKPNGMIELAQDQCDQCGMGKRNATCVKTHMIAHPTRKTLPTAKLALLGCHGAVGLFSVKQPFVALNHFGQNAREKLII